MVLGAMGCFPQLTVGAPILRVKTRVKIKVKQRAVKINGLSENTLKLDKNYKIITFLDRILELFKNTRHFNFTELKRFLKLWM